MFFTGGFCFRGRCPMPTIDSDLQRKALKRELAKSRQVGDFITCDGGPVLGRPGRCPRGHQHHAARTLAG
jgi:hypothetical protein